MTQEEKELLLKDLCARLPYGVRIGYKCGHIYELRSVLKCGMVLIADIITNECISTCIENIGPYLFPMSSMTEEQREEFLNIQVEERKILFDALIEYRYGKRDKKPVIAPYKQIEWLNKNNFDYRGLIPMGLANDATGKNIY